MAEKKKSTGSNYLASAFVGAIVIALVKCFWPKQIPFDAFEFWTPKGAEGGWTAHAIAWLKIAWPIFLWGGGITALASFLTKNDYRMNRHAEAHFIAGGINSLWAGVAEEICFRWLIFLSAIPLGKLVNWLLLGFMGWGIPEHLFVWILRPLADFTTLHGLHPWLYSASGWAVGAAILGANASFRNGHKYLGWFGYVNSWFLGMYFFWVMFTYGLPAAILIHFAYDLLIYAVRYVDMVIERATGNG